ncbi:ribbon-helix-helix protein, CopG family [bacterium]|nr:ribbon-helix-helix protein, CopG family [bacterium]
MKRTTIFADEELLEQLREISAEEKSSVAETMRKAMRSYVQQRRRKKRKLSFVGIASSGRKDIAERHEELLWKKNTK